MRIYEFDQYSIHCLNGCYHNLNNNIHCGEEFQTQMNTVVNSYPVPAYGQKNYNCSEYFRKKYSFTSIVLDPVTTPFFL
jgi:hypothetical protein